ncbi:hypothetical protein B7463_g9422, partial [Scytalidium lignicola]
MQITKALVDNADALSDGGSMDSSASSQDASTPEPSGSSDDDFPAPDESSHNATTDVQYTLETQASASTVASELPVPNDPPTAADWNAYRQVFTQLYVAEGRTLRDTMQIMEQTYKFKATPRMFKKRAADWGLRKYHPRKTSANTDDPPMNRSVSGPFQNSVALRRSPNLISHGSSYRRKPSNRPQWYKFNNETSKFSRSSQTSPPFQPLSSSDQESSDSPEIFASSSSKRSIQGSIHPYRQSQHGTPSFRISRTSPKMRSRTEIDLTEITRRPGRQYNHDEDIERYLRRKEPNLSLTRFRAISYDLKVVEAILDQVHQYYDSFTDVQWIRKFPSSPRTVMKEMTLCIDLGQAFPQGKEAPIHPTQIFGRYMVAVELLKSRRLKDQQEGWRLIHEAFDLFKPVLAQQHTQLLRYFFQQIYDYRLNDHPDIRKRIFELATAMASVTLGEQHPITRICHLLPQVEEKDEICVLAWRKSLELIDANLGEASDDSLRSKLALSGDLIDQSKFQEAENLLLRMLRTPGRVPTDYYMRSTLLRLAWLYRLQNKYTEAEDSLYEVMRRCRQCNLGGIEPADAIYIAAQTNLAQSLCSRKEFHPGEVVLQAALDSCTRTYGPEHGYTTSVADELEKISPYMRRWIKVISQDEFHKTIENEAAGAIITTEIFSDVASYWRWSWIKSECKYVKSIHDRFRDSIRPGAAIPHLYDRALGSLELFLVNEVLKRGAFLGGVMPQRPGFSQNWNVKWRPDVGPSVIDWPSAEKCQSR